MINYTGGVEMVGDGIRLDGQLVQSAGTVTVFKDVSVHFFDENRQRIDRQELGALDVAIELDITVNETPQWVVFYSPEFWEDVPAEVEGPVTADYMVWQPARGLYSHVSATSVGELPIDPRTR